MIIKTINWKKDYVYEKDESINNLQSLYQKEQEKNKNENYKYEYKEQAMIPYFSYIDKNWNEIKFALKYSW